MGADLELIDPDGDVDAQAELMDTACSSLGFFRIRFDCVDDSIREAAWIDARKFFALPDEAKQAAGFPEAGYPYGFSPFRFESLAASQGVDTPPDLKESYSVGPDCLGPPPAKLADDEAWIRSPSVWPTEPAGLRTSWPAYFQALSDVSAKLLRIMAVALELPADYFDPLIDRHTSAMRALNYPDLSESHPGSLRAGAHPAPLRAGAHPAPLRAGAHPAPLRAGAHSDYGTLTILRTDGVPGLEVQNPDGSWTAIAHEPDTFVVNLGDSIAQWTNDRWRSTVHRVTTVDSSARKSMAFFHMANWDAEISCLPTCTAADNPPKYEPVLAGPWLMSKFQRTVT